MARNVRCALIQAGNAIPTDRPLAQIRKAMIDKHLKLIDQAARKKTQILCLQELFYGPYFCAEQNARWYELTERVPDGPTTRLMQKVAKKHRMVIVVPVYEEQMPGVYFNTAAVIDADGKYLGKYRKHHIPHCHPGFWEKFSRPAISVIPYSRRSMLASVCTSATTAISPRAPAFSD
jgi:beta-ureidopropionase